MIWGSTDGPKCFSVQPEWTKGNGCRLKHGKFHLHKRWHRKRKRRKMPAFYSGTGEALGQVAQRGHTLHLLKIFKILGRTAVADPTVSKGMDSGISGSLPASTMPRFWSWQKVMGQSHNKDYFSLGKRVLIKQKWNMSGTQSSNSISLQHKHWVEI